jgi:nicotinamidase-related amidase
MTHRFTKGAGALLVVDLQERLGAAMPADRLERVINRTRAAIEGAKALGLPIIVTEQYPRGLGPTIAAVKDYETGLSLCRDAGATLTTVEAALFDALGKAGGPEFKAISAAVK